MYVYRELVTTHNPLHTAQTQRRRGMTLERALVLKEACDKEGGRTVVRFAPTLPFPEEKRYVVVDSGVEEIKWSGMTHKLYTERERAL